MLQRYNSTKKYYFVSLEDTNAWFFLKVSYKKNFIMFFFLYVNSPVCMHWGIFLLISWFRLKILNWKAGSDSVLTLINFQHFYKLLGVTDFYFTPKWFEILIQNVLYQNLSFYSTDENYLSFQHSAELPSGYQKALYGVW